MKNEYRFSGRHFFFYLGLDWGGLRREWIDVLCTELFDPDKSGLFTRFTDNPQGLVSLFTRFTDNPQGLVSILLGFQITLRD